MAKLGIAVLFVALTLASLIVWWATQSEFWLGIFGNMLVGAVTLLCVNYLLDLSTDNRKKPAVAVANAAARAVLGEGRKLLFDLYGATVLSGLISKSDHRRIADSGKLIGLAPFLAKTDVRSDGFSHPRQPAISLMQQSATGIQQATNLTLSTHGIYLEPTVTAALYTLSQTGIVTFIIVTMSYGMVIDFVTVEMIEEYITALDGLEQALIAAQPKDRTTIKHFSAFQLLEQPGIFKD